MSTKASFAQRTMLARETREQFLAEVGHAMVELGAAVQEHLTTLINDVGSAREMQGRRDAWTLYQSRRAAWIDGTLKDWQATLKPAVVAPRKDLEGGLELLGTEVVENKIVASRLVLSVMEKVNAELNDLSVRIKLLEGSDELHDNDIFRPEVLVLLMIEQWALAGMPRDAWSMVNDVARDLLTQRVNQAYAHANEYLIKRGVLPTIELKDRVRRVTSTPPRRGQSSSSQAADQAPNQTPLERSFGADSGPAGYYGDARNQGGFSGGGGQGDAGQGGQVRAAPGPTYGDARNQGGFSGGGGQGDAGQGGQVRAAPGPTSGGHFGSGHGSGSGQTSSGRRSSGYGQALDETRMLTSITPLARARSRAQGVLGQLKRLLMGSGGADFEATHYQAPSPALAAALAVRPGPAGFGSGGGTVLEDYSPAGVARVAGELRRRTTDLKNKAETKSEKATIEIVALMFQAILQEDRIPPAIRVWFARLQMPVLRVALAEPDFFSTLNHPARRLIDRMGSCVMGFDASGINGSALESEIKRVVQVIEQYPETGRRVYQLVYDRQRCHSKSRQCGPASGTKGNTDHPVHHRDARHAQGAAGT
jgi:hypothetical protein